MLTQLRSITRIYNIVYLFTLTPTINHYLRELTWTLTQQTVCHSTCSCDSPRTTDERVPVLIMKKIIMATKVRITRPQERLPTPCSSPQLMPFNISYTGPAPISTFFRIKETSTDAAAPGAGPSSSIQQTSMSEMLSSEKEKPSVDIEAETEAKRQGNPGRRLISVFRGRRVVGLEVPLPEGYSGVTLRSGSARQSHVPPTSRRMEYKNAGMRNKNTRRNKPAGHLTRSSWKTEADEEIHDVLGGAMHDGGDLEASNPPASVTEDAVRSLCPTGRFNSLTIWSPDIIVDEGQDEFIRALKDWTAIAAEVRNIHPNSDGLISSKLYRCIKLRMITYRVFMLVVLAVLFASSVLHRNHVACDSGKRISFTLVGVEGKRTSILLRTLLLNGTGQAY